MRRRETRARRCWRWRALVLRVLATGPPRPFLPAARRSARRDARPRRAPSGSCGVRRTGGLKRVLLTHERARTHPSSRTPGTDRSSRTPLGSQRQAGAGGGRIYGRWAPQGCRGLGCASTLTRFQRWHAADAMADLELKRTPADHRRYALEGVGTLRLEGFASRAATAEAGGSSWRIARRGFWRRVIEATDAAGAAVGEFEPRARHPRRQGLGPAAGHGHRRRPRCDRPGAAALRGLRRPRTGRGRRGRHGGGQLGHLTEPDSTQARDGDPSRTRRDALLLRTMRAAVAGWSASAARRLLAGDQGQRAAVDAVFSRAFSAAAVTGTEAEATRFMGLRLWRPPSRRRGRSRVVVERQSGRAEARGA